MKKEKPETKLCKHCKTEIPYEAKVCPQCRKKQKGGKLKWIVIILLVLFVLVALFGGDSYDLSDDASTMSEEDYKAACEETTYEDLARNADDLVGTKYKFTGQIQQVIYDSEGGESEYMISVTKNEYDWWDDNVYVYFDEGENDTKFLEDDIVTFYGEASGEETYTSVLGESITIPKISVVYMDLEK